MLDLGVGKLPPLEEGTLAHHGPEKANLAARVEYLKQTLGIDASQIPHPLKENKMLPKRLVADVLVDMITACQTAQGIVSQFSDYVAPTRIESYFEVIIRPLNALMRTRRSKGLQADIQLPDGRTLREVSLTHNYAPARSDNLTRDGYFTAILEVFEASLLKKLGNQP